MSPDGTSEFPASSLFLVLVTASRGLDERDRDLVLEQFVDLDIRAEGRQVRLVHGKAKGGDEIAAQEAEKLGWQIDPHPADWEGPCIRTCRPGHRRVRTGGGDYCPAIGMYRNQEMVDLVASFMAGGADAACRAFILNGSRGATGCADAAEKAGIPTLRLPVVRAGVDSSPRRRS